MSEAGYPPIGQSAGKDRLYRCKLVSNRIYLNSDPAMPYQLPHEWSVNELADEIIRACADYRLYTTLEDARIHAKSIVAQILRDPRQTEGGFAIGWD